MNLRIAIAIGSFVAALAMLVSCGNDNGDPFVDISPEHEFFPYEIGRSATYRVDSSIYDESEDTILRSSSIVQELVTDTFRDLSGQLHYRVDQSKYDSTSGSWNYIHTYAAALGEEFALWTEGNLTYRKLPFPPGEGDSWDGNALFNTDIVILVAGESIRPFKDWPGEYVILSRSESEEVGGDMYEDVVTVLHVDFDAIIERRYSLEIYAKGVGLIRKEMAILDTQCRDWNSDLVICATIPWEIRAERGFSLTKQYIP